MRFYRVFLKYNVFLCLFFLPVFLFAQNSTNEITLETEIANLTSQLEKVSSNEKKIQILEKIGRSQEFSNMFPEAEQAYFECAELAGANQKIKFILNAVRCSLSYGNSERADELLAKIANGARSNEYTARFKLYAIWSWLSKCNSYDETFEPIAILKSYLELGSMQEVRPQMLFTIWYITGEIKYAEMLKNEFPQSPEYAIICSRMEISPSPFWFFSARKLGDLKEIEELTKDTREKAAQNTVKSARAVASVPYEVNPDSKRSAGDSIKNDTNVAIKERGQKINEKSNSDNGVSGGIIKYYQLGFFSRIENAEDLVKRVSAKGIKAEIREDIKPSGNKYYQVVVVSSDEKMATIIKNSGFECYPIFD
ncbi:MAG: SPOR domain-containing protein [Treponemataceae bacterium]|nr:SPOR domain-containing protein [Spirochaetales bacterium]MDY6030765.1 SPOR domain-containing protein [Treponemataceae bacterium]